MPHATPEIADSTMMLRLPQSVHSRLKTEAAERGYATAEDYVLDLIHPTDEHTDQEIEAMALKSLASGPATPFTGADWVEVRRRSQALIDSGKVR